MQLTVEQHIIFMRAWLAVTRSGIHQGLTSSARRAVLSMATVMDPTFPSDLKPCVPLLAVAMAYPNQAEQAQQVVPKANPPL